jgi:hypothetical protein
MNRPNDTLNDPSAIVINRIELEKFDGSKKIDIKPLTISIRLSSSLTYPTIYAYLLIGDTNNLLDNEDFALVGEEFITIDIKQPVQSPELPAREFSYKFVVNKIDTEVPSEDSFGSLYKIELISVDKLINSGAIRSKGYSNTHTNIVKSIIENELKSDVPIVNFEDTNGTTQYAFVESKPFEKIMTVASQAYNNREFLTSTFCFYENFEGYNFESFENIIQRNLEITPRKFSYTMTTSADRDGHKSIVSYVRPYRFHTSTRIAQGYYSTKVISYNLLEKRAEIQQITLPDELKKVESRLNSIDPRSSQAFIDRIKDMGSSTYLIPYAPPYAYPNPERVDYTNSSLLYASPFSILLGENTLHVKVYGALDIDSGKIIELEFPDNKNTADSTKSIDKDLSGKYIVTDTTHDIDLSGRGKIEFFTNITCVKESSLRRINYYDKQLTTDSINIRALQEQ